jgi:transposase IS116/IS110/IS902 family protein
VHVFAVRAEELIEDRPELIAVVGPLLKARKAIEQQTDDLDRKVLKLAVHNAQVRRFMTVPGVGPITALCFKATIDDPTRFKRSRSVGAYVGLTTRRHASRHQAAGCARQPDEQIFARVHHTDAHEGSAQPASDPGATLIALNLQGLGSKNAGLAAGVGPRPRIGSTAVLSHPPDAVTNDSRCGGCGDEVRGLSCGVRARAARPRL